MTRKLISKAATVAFSAALVSVGASVASAQSASLGLSPRIGLFQSVDSRVSGTFFAIGVDYKLNALPASIPSSGVVGYWGVSLDYYDRGGASNLPIVLNYNLRQGSLTFAAGLGGEFYDLDKFGSSTGTGIDGQLSVSYNVKTPVLPIFLQAKYFFSGRPELSGLGLYVGARF